MKKQMIAMSLVALVVATGVVTLVVAKDKEEKDEVVTLAQTPAAVQQTIQQHAVAAEVKKIEKGDEDGKTEYEVELVKAGKKSEIKVAADGKLLSTEEEIVLNDAPEAVRATITAQAADGKVCGVEKVTEDGKTVFEAKIEKGKKTFEVVVAPDGKLEKTKELKDGKD